MMCGLYYIFIEPSLSTFSGFSNIIIIVVVAAAIIKIEGGYKYCFISLLFREIIYFKYFSHIRKLKFSSIILTTPQHNIE